MPDPAHIIVIGAGFAGLTAAYKLHKQGHKVTVLEARPRVSGRVWSRTLPNGTTVEMGAEWICPGENDIKALAQELSVPLAQVGVDFMIRDVTNGTAVSLEKQRQALKITTDQVRQLDETAVANTSIAQFLANLPLTQPQRQLIATRLQGSFGRDLAHICLPMLIEDGLGDEDDHTYYRVVGGNQTIAKTLASHLPDVRLEHEVTRISHSDNQVTIHGRHHNTSFQLEADAAVIAVPITILQTLPFDPPLPADRNEAIQQVPMGIAAKIAAGTETPPPLRAIQDVINPYWCWTGKRADGTVRSAVTAFCGSVQAQTNLATNSHDPATWFGKLQAANPDLTFIDEPIMVDWSQDKWAQGCYSAYNQVAFERYPLLSQPLNNTLFFAGEHTAAHSGTMNGAIASGLKAAEQIKQKG